MQVIERAKTPNGIAIQIEDWHEDYSCFADSGTVATYPLAIKTNNTSILQYPEANKTFRLALNFDTKNEAKECFDALKNGSKQIKDYYINFNNKDYIDFI